MSSYGSLGDHARTHDEEAFADAKVAVKFCNFGLVTSRKWNAAYVTVLDGIVNVYDSKESCVENPQSQVLQISLATKGTRHSPIKVKNYSKDPLKVIEFHCFNIEIDNGMFAAAKMIKIGCFDRADAEKLCKAIRLAID